MKCAHCKQDKPEEEFINKRNGGFTKRCLRCRENLDQGHKRWHQRNPDHNRKYLQKYHYGLSEEEYSTLLQVQRGMCAICDVVLDNFKHTHVDHCHDSKLVRGILCNNCNLGIGHLKHNVQTLQRAIVYLQGTFNDGSSNVSSTEVSESRRPLES